MRTFAQKQRPEQNSKSASSVRPSLAFLEQRREVRSILNLQRTIGNQAVQRLSQSRAEDNEEGLFTSTSPRFTHDFAKIPMCGNGRAMVQTKLTVGTPGDKYEQEADQVAAEVMRMPEPLLQSAYPCVEGSPRCQREQSNQKNQQTTRTQSSRSKWSETPPLVQKALRSSGQPLDQDTRSFFEPRYQYDFAKVRVHTNKTATEYARLLSANAFTIGQDIVFGSHQFAPKTDEGKRLLAHELTHVVQQTGLPQRIIQRRPIRRGANQWFLNEVPIGTSYTDFLQNVFRECCWITTCQSDGGVFLDDLLVNHSNLAQVHTWIDDLPRNRNDTTPVFIRHPEQFYNVPINEIRSVNLHLRTHLNEEESAIGAMQFTVTRRRLINERLPCTRERTLNVYAVHLPGATRIVESDIRFANNILCQCGIELNLAGSQNWSTNLLDSTLPRNTLNFYGRSRAAAETREMLAHRPGGNMIHIYYVPIVTLRNVLGYAFNTEGSEQYLGSAINSILIVNRAGQGTLAHEMGHILLDSGHPGIFTNLMAHGPLGARTYVLLRRQCQRMQRFPGF
jgi:uncharacterized protein DUF4157